MRWSLQITKYDPHFSEATVIPFYFEEEHVTDPHYGDAFDKAASLFQELQNQFSNYFVDQRFTQETNKFLDKVKNDYFNTQELKLGHAVVKFENNHGVFMGYVRSPWPDTYFDADGYENIIKYLSEKDDLPELEKRSVERLLLV